MNRNDKITLSMIAGSLSIGLTALLINAIVIAQTPTQDRLFERNFCITEETILDDILYTTGEQLSYDSSGCPISVKIIHRWNELSITSQNTIMARMTTNGYIDKGLITESVSR